MDNVGTTLLVAIIVVLTICFILSAVSGVSKGIQWLSNINMVLAGILALVVFIGGPTILILNLLPTDDRRLLRQPRTDGRPHRGHRRRRHRHLAGRLDDLLLGVVDLLDAVRRHVHRAHQPRAHHPAVRRGRHPDPRAPSACCGSRSSAAPRSQLQRNGTDLASRPDRRPAVRPARHDAARRRARRDRDAARRDLLRLRRRRRVDRDGHALAARHDPPHRAASWSSGAR